MKIGAVGPQPSKASAAFFVPRNIPASWLGPLGFILLLSALCLHAPAQVTYTLQNIVDTDDPIPGGTGMFSSLGTPSIDHATISFLGGGSGFQQGVYHVLTPASPDKIADRTTPVPDGEGSFLLFTTPSSGDDGVAFSGAGTNGQEGVYYHDGNALVKVADTNTFVPGTAERFGTFRDGFSVTDEGSIAFRAASTSGTLGLYSWDGTNITKVADSGMAFPGSIGSTFSDFSSPSIDRGSVAFKGTGSGGEQGIFIWKDGAMNTVATTNTLIPPNHTEKFILLDAPSVSMENVSFRGKGPGGVPGIYARINGTLVRVADTSTSIPDGPGAFSFFGPSPSISGACVAFFGSGSTTGVYANISGPLSAVLSITNLLDGKTMESLSFGREGLSGDQMILNVSFSDFSQGLFLANPADTDGDGMPDWWELKHGLSPTDDGTGDPKNGPQGNIDLDGGVNIQEYLADTDPTNSLSSLRLEIALVPPITEELSFASSSHRVYELKASANLPEGAWTNRLSPIYGTGNTISFSNTITGALTYYRLLAEFP